MKKNLPEVMNGNAPEGSVDEKVPKTSRVNKI